MGWSIGYDEKWKRDIGYGVPCKCDHPGCDAEIDRGLAFVCCDQQPHGGERGCGLYFCTDHQHMTEKHHQLCERCLRGNPPFAAKPDVPEWIHHKLTDESWQQWRDENPGEDTRLSNSQADPP
jgi:hypothetical protein